MCGFAGIYKKNFDVDFKSIIPYLLHRGPDEIGYFKNDECSLFSTRLKIRDLNNGKQPFTKYESNNQGFLSYNGEIYNFFELKKKFKNINSDCDTELIYEIFEQKEEDILKSINDLQGQFAISYFNLKKKILYLARDKLGEKPLYWSRHKNSIIFSSEIKSLLFLKNQKPEFDTQQILSINHLWSTHPSKTPYKNIHSIEPGSIYKFHMDGKIIKKLYEYPISNFNSKFYLNQNSKKITISDRNIGVYLSGGIDSFISTKLISKNVKKIKSFGLSFANRQFDEKAKQLKAAKLLGTDHYNVTFKDEDFFENLLSASFFAEVPNTRFAHIPMYLLSKKAKSEKTPVIITGEGADEFFLGYDVFLENFIINNINKTKFVKKYVESMFVYMPQNFSKGKFSNYKLETYKNLKIKLREMSAFGINISRFQMGEFFHNQFFPDQKNYFINHFKNYIKRKYSKFNHYNNIKKTQIIEIETLLSGNLLGVQGDKMSMANGIETRSPYLDKNLLSINYKKIDDIYDFRLKQKPLLKKNFLKTYKKYPKIFNQKFPFRAPENFLLNKKGKDFFNSIMNANFKNDFSIINKTKTNLLIDELTKAKFRQPSKLQALTLLTNIHAVYYALTHMKNYVTSASSLKKYKRVFSAKNKKFQLKIFANENISI